MTGEFFICGSMEIEIIVNFTIGKSDCKGKDVDCDGMVGRPFDRLRDRTIALLRDRTNGFENLEKPCIIENYDEEAIYNDGLGGDFLWRVDGTD